MFFSNVSSFCNSGCNVGAFSNPDTYFEATEIMNSLFLGTTYDADDEQELLRRSVRDFAETEIRPHVREWDEAQHFPSEVVPAMAALGLMGIQIPECYGGSGMSSVDSR